MTTTRLALKLDVDTFAGYLYGVPALLDLFDAKGISASIFFSMGPDNSGKAIRRIFRKGFVKKMVRTKAPSTYGLKTLLYGTLLPAPQIVAKKPEILQRAAIRHDCGVHAWDHVHIQDNLGSMSLDEIRSEYKKAFDLFEKITGRRARSAAAPGWQATADSFAVMDELALDYASDTRGENPFYPEIREHVYKTLQIPTTLPTMDEMHGPDAAFGVAGLWLSELRRETEVLTIHAEMEGRGKLAEFAQFVDRATVAGIKFVTLGEIARNARDTALVGGVRPGVVQGRSGEVIKQVPYSAQTP